MNSISPSPLSTATNATQAAGNARSASAAQTLSGSHAKDGNVKTSFQDFAAGTFYKEMLKSLRKLHNKPAYFYGGQAEQIFQGQMDQQVAEDMAHSHGNQVAGSLYQAYLHRTA